MCSSGAASVWRPMTASCPWTCLYYLAVHTLSVTTDIEVVCIFLQTFFHHCTPSPRGQTTQCHAAVRLLRFIGTFMTPMVDRGTLTS